MYLLYLMKIGGEDKHQGKPEVEILAQKIKYTIQSSQDEYKWREGNNYLSIFEIIESKESSEDNYEDSSESENRSKKEQGASTKAKSVMNNNSKSREKNGFPSLGKRPLDEAPKQKVQNSQLFSRSQSKEAALNNFSLKLSQKYQDKMKDTKNVIIISLPDFSIDIKIILCQLHKPMMEEESKDPIQIYQELAILLKLASECLTIYRDSMDNILFIYFKRVRNESVDSNGHLYSIVETNIHELKNRNPSDYPIKLRLLLKNIKIYVSLSKLLERISNRGQNRHYYIFNPNYYGSSGKRSIGFNPEDKTFEVSYEDISSDFSSKDNPNFSVIQARIPQPSFFSLFDFDFIRFNTNNENIKLSFKERYEQVLHSDNDETYILSKKEICNFEDYFKTQRKYCNIIEKLIIDLRNMDKVFRVKNSNNYLVFDIEVIQSELEKLREKSPEIQAWFTFKNLENKALFYSVKKNYKMTNILELPKNLCGRIKFLPPKRAVFGIFSYHSQEEYKMIINTLYTDQNEE